MRTNPATPTNLVTDPVCGMLIDPAEAAGISHSGGATHYFCALACKREFDAGHGTIVEPPAAASSCCGGSSRSLG